MSRREEHSDAVLDLLDRYGADMSQMTEQKNSEVSGFGIRD